MKNIFMLKKESNSDLFLRIIYKSKDNSFQGFYSKFKYFFRNTPLV